MEDYLNRANRLFDNGPGVQIAVRHNGESIYYKAATNEFGVLDSDGETIVTYLAPDEEEKYWDRQVLDAMKGGGRYKKQ